ncbi:hypothetical protein F5Y04DRAFT_274241 [Hypomontagnella monticulosa]|nr:hypothetical protein F5Y04DRAFT_274241 [Hypomontagnella monticulosa]
MPHHHHHHHRRSTSTDYSSSPGANERAGSCPHCPHCNGVPFQVTNNNGAWPFVGGFLGWLLGTPQQRGGYEGDVNLALNMSIPHHNSRVGIKCPKCNHTLASATPAYVTEDVRPSRHATPAPAERTEPRHRNDTLEPDFMDQLNEHLPYFSNAELIEIILGMCLISPEAHKCVEKALNRTSSRRRHERLIQYAEEGVHIRLQQYTRSPLKEVIGALCWEVPSIQRRLRHFIVAIKCRKQDDGVWAPME